MQNYANFLQQCEEKYNIAKFMFFVKTMFSPNKQVSGTERIAVKIPTMVKHPREMDGQPSPAFILQRPTLRGRRQQKLSQRQRPEVSGDPDSGERNKLSSWSAGEEGSAAGRVQQQLSPIVNGHHCDSWDTRGCGEAGRPDYAAGCSDVDRRNAIHPGDDVRSDVADSREGQPVSENSDCSSGHRIDNGGCREAVRSLATGSDIRPGRADFCSDNRLATNGSEDNRLATNGSEDYRLAINGSEDNRLAIRGSEDNSLAINGSVDNRLVSNGSKGNRLTTNGSEDNGSEGYRLGAAQAVEGAPTYSAFKVGQKVQVIHCLQF